MVYVIFSALLVLLFSSKKFFLTKSILISTILVITSTWHFVNSVSGNGIDYATLYHLKSGLGGAGISGFTNVIIVLVACYTASFLPTLLSARLKKYALEGHWLVFPAFIIIFFACLTATQAFRDIVELYRFTRYTESSSVAKEYVAPQPKMTDRRNVVYIYAESLERTYFEEGTFPGLLPNIKKLATQGVDFTNVKSLDGSGWTVAGIVASMCGVPLTAWSSEDRGSLERIQKFLPGAHCLSDFLNAQKYNVEFIGGASKEFAGKGSFLASHGFTTIRDLDYFKTLGVGNSRFSEWGAQDDILLEQAFERFMTLSEEKDPFFLSVLTLDTHHPIGHIPLACQMDELKSDYQSDHKILEAIHCSDKLISAFIKKIRSSPYAKNTTIVLASDHLAMPNDAMHLLEGKKRRNLFIILDERLKAATISRHGSTFDIGATLLSLMTRKAESVGFGRSLFYEAKDGVSKADFQRKSLAPYVSYGKGLWMLSMGSKVEVSSDKLKLKNQEVELPVIFKYDESGRINELQITQVKKSYLSAKEKVSLGYIDRCIAFNVIEGGGEWCMILHDTEGKSYIYDEEDLSGGVDLIKPNPKKSTSQPELSTTYIIQEGFPENYPSLISGRIENGSVVSQATSAVLFSGPFVPLAPGEYELILRGSISGHSNNSWIDVISDQGSKVHVRLPLKESAGSGTVLVKQRFTLKEHANNVEVRVFSSAEDIIQIDGYTVLPTVIPTHQKKGHPK